MMTLRRIVVGVDGTVTSAAAVYWAVREARMRRAAIHLIYACHHDPRLRAPYAPVGKTPGREEREAAAKAQLAAAAALVRRRLPNIRVTAELAYEPPARALIDRAAGAELLVLGTTHPASPAGRQATHVIGPVARACLQYAPCPVVVVAPSAGQAEHDYGHAWPPHSVPHQRPLLVPAG
jgi:nucleotide-binding universal stress UspA family protein